MILAFYPRIIEYDKPQEADYKGPQANLTFTVELLVAFCKDIRGC